MLSAVEPEENIQIEEEELKKELITADLYQELPSEDEHDDVDFCPEETTDQVSHD